MTNNERIDEGTLEADRTEVHPDRDSVQAPEDVEVQLRAVLGKAGEREITADVFTSKKIPPEPRPGIVFLHGGSWWKGGPSQFHRRAARLASKYNFFAISVDYRLSDVAPFPAALQDGKLGMRYVRSRAKELNIDPERICISGGSAGGHLSSLILTTAGVSQYEGTAGYDEFASHANLGVIFNGEFDMWDLVDKGSLIEPMEQFFGGPPEEIPGRYEEATSLHRVHRYVPPVLLLHGTVDKCVSHEQSIAFANAVRAHGGHAEIDNYKNQPHAWFNREPHHEETTRRMEKFLMEQFNL